MKHLQRSSNHSRTGANQIVQRSAQTPFGGGSLEDFVHLFVNVLPRVEQRRHLLTYLTGLLDGSPAKSIDAIASRLAVIPSDRGRLAQALQHFVSSSPWEEKKMLDHLRMAISQAIANDNDPTILVISELDFPKKGLHSVGVQRQLARSRNLKVNCQVAITLGCLIGEIYIPLRIQIYLPGRWLQDRTDTAERTVPLEHRHFLSKESIALLLIDEILPPYHDGMILVADPSLVASAELTREIANRNLSLVLPRSTAADFSSTRKISNSRALESLEAARKSHEIMKLELGLDQFEGRSWRGWHHHAALVFIAHGYNLLRESV